MFNQGIENLKSKATCVWSNTIHYLWNVSPQMVTDITTRCSTKAFTRQPYARKSCPSRGSRIAATWRVAMYAYLLIGIGRFVIGSLILATGEKYGKSS